MQIISHSPLDTERAGREFASRLKPGDVIAFFGGMGMGKTVFVRGLAQGLHIETPVSSPTFALVHEYGGNPPLFHFDMYRITGSEDLETTGFFDYLSQGGICAVEWSENIESDLPSDAYRVRIREGEDENTRIITIEGGSGNENTGD